MYNISDVYTQSLDVTFKQVSKGVKTHRVDDLMPSTTYQFCYEICTLESLCTKGPVDYVTTLPSAPTGQSKPLVLGIGVDNVTLSWNAPDNPNGEIRK